MDDNVLSSGPIRFLIIALNSWWLVVYIQVVKLLKYTLKTPPDFPSNPPQLDDADCS